MKLNQKCENFHFIWKTCIFVFLSNGVFRTVARAFPPSLRLIFAEKRLKGARYYV